MWNSTFKVKPGGKSLSQKTPIKQSAWVKKPKKKRAGHNKSMLEACRGQECYLRIPHVCLGVAGRNTVVPAHSNQQKHGKGMGLKAKDEFTVPACAACHSWIDQGSADREVKFSYWDAGFARWRPIRERNIERMQS